MHETIAEPLVELALLLSIPAGGESYPAPTIARLLDEPGLAELTARRVLVAVISLGRTVLANWTLTYPDQDGPPLAISAAESWVAAPSHGAADQAAQAAELAIQQSMAVWHRPQQHAAWAGRTAAWVAMAPKFDWPAVAAVFGACQAIGKEQVIAALASSRSE